MDRLNGWLLTEMSDEAALCIAVIVGWPDELPALVYADWLAEHGDETFERYIRLVLGGGEARVETAFENVGRWAIPHGSKRRRENVQFYYANDWDVFYLLVEHKLVRRVGRDTSRDGERSDWTPVRTLPANTFVQGSGIEDWYSPTHGAVLMCNGQEPTAPAEPTLMDLRGFVARLINPSG